MPAVHLAGYAAFHIGAFQAHRIAAPIKLDEHQQKDQGNAAQYRPGKGGQPFLIPQGFDDQRYYHQVGGQAQQGH